MALEFNKAFQTENCRCFDFPECLPFQNPHPWIGKIPTAFAFLDLLNYIAKEDPELAGLKGCNVTTKVPIAQQVWEQSSVTDALMMAKKPSDAQGILTLYQNKAQHLTLREWQEPCQDWQSWFINYFKEPVNATNHRYIHWFVDDEGSAAKTEVVRKLLYEKNKDWLLIRDFGKGGDAAQIVVGELSRGWTGHAAFIDIPRLAEVKHSMYTSIECLCDGMITSTKYAGRTFFWNSGHVIVFANWPPKYCHVTANRWQIYYINKGERLETNPHSGLEFERNHVSKPRKCSGRMWIESYRREHMHDPPQALMRKLLKKDSIDYPKGAPSEEDIVPKGFSEDDFLL